MLNRLPKMMPPLSMLLDDIGAPSSNQIAKALQVSERHVKAWRASDEAPHLAALSLFWLTRWGQSLIACEAVNAASMAHGLAACHELEVTRLRGELARVLSIAEFGCANDPLAGNLHRIANRVQARA